MNTYLNPQAAAEACGAQILSWLAEAQRTAKMVSLAVSGGSTPKIMFDWIAKQHFDWSTVHLFWVDERAVPPDDDQSNFRMTKEHLIEPAGIPEANVHRVLAELDADKAAHFYEDEIALHFRICDGDLPRFDVIHLGMGADAHTASLFPGERLIHDRKQITAAVHVKKLGQSRITLLPAVLLQASNVAILACGEDKAEPLAQVLNSPYAPAEYPLQVVARNRTSVHWFVDQAAAARLA
ncbi:MAG TPA: 6-phosphogluconolactonase [Bryobacteraceae bacterium]|nr:6-phosphogluconolactonase [Bryobacteraceae bacterium]